MARRDCSEVSPGCPVELTVYGYVPNEAGNLTFLALFSVCALFQLVAGTYHRSWSFLVALAGGSIMEAVGYVGRVMMHSNVWNQAGFKIQICCLVLAPSFVAAGIYLSLKHIILYVDPSVSRLKPRLYTWLFIGFDIFSIMMQGAGGGIAASAGGNMKILNTGNNLIVTGIAIQVATMAICGFMALDYYLRHKKAGKIGTAVSGHDVKATPVMNYNRFKVFVGAEILAYFTVLIRCVYRLPEMSGGWGNPLMRRENDFLILDGMMVSIAVVAFSVFHPGWWFPPMTGRWQKKRSPIESEDVQSSDNEPKMAAVSEPYA